MTEVEFFILYIIFVTIYWHFVCLWKEVKGLKELLAKKDKTK